MEKVKLRAIRFVFNDSHVSYSDLRSRAGRPLLYIDRLKAVVTEVFRMYSNVYPEYNRSIITKSSTSYNVRNSKCLEIPTFQTPRHGKYTFRYEAAKLCDILENKYKM